MRGVHRLSPPRSRWARLLYVLTGRHWWITGAIQVSSRPAPVWVRVRRG